MGLFSLLFWHSDCFTVDSIEIYFNTSINGVNLIMAVRPFASKFDGWCAKRKQGCGKRITKGDSMGRSKFGEYVCINCANKRFDSNTLVKEPVPDRV